MCNKETKYDKEVDIQFRMWYVEGAGQLCEQCWNKVYEK